MTITEKTVDVTMASCTLERYLTECNPRTTHSDVPNKPQSPTLPTEDSHIRRQLELEAKNKHFPWKITSRETVRKPKWRKVLWYTYLIVIH